MIKIILIYFLTLLIFFIFPENKIRLISTLVLYFISCNIFNVGIIKTILYLFISFLCVMTESLFINSFKNTWEYKKSDILGIPLWLIPLWGIAILLVINIKKNIETIKLFFVK
jgi:uncharacterized membrane protein